MDVLADVLRVVRLSGAIFLTGEFSAPWSLDESPEDTRRALMPQSAPDCFSIFHIVAEGNGWVELRGSRQPVQLQAGDVILFPRGDRHALSSAPKLTATPSGGAIFKPGMTTRVCIGGGGKVTRFVCGYLHADQRFTPLLSALPPMLHVRSRAEGASVVPVGGTAAGSTANMPADATMWLETTLRYLTTLAHSTDAGNSPVLARLTETLFIELVRRYMEQLPPEQTGWLAGLKDPHVGRAIELLHAEPARAWTVEELAYSVGMSRSALAARFNDLLRETPMRYLAAWRMQLAMQHLSEGSRSIPDIAELVGYESEAAFNRAFKRHTGQPPAAWRKAALVEPGSALRHE